MNSKFTFYMQLHSCRSRSRTGGNLAEEKKLLSLAWREVGGGLGSLPEAGGGVDESLVLLLPVLEKEENRPCRGEGKLTAGAVGVAEERTATPAAFGKEESFWARWWLLALPSPPL